MNNDINFFGSNEAAIEFIKSSIDTSDMFIEHYDFVINDISSNISDITLERTKEPTIAFLKSMRKNWMTFKTELKTKLNVLNTEMNKTDEGK